MASHDRADSTNRKTATVSTHQTEISLQIWQGDRECLSSEGILYERKISVEIIIMKIDRVHPPPYFNDKAYLPLPDAGMKI